MKKQFHSLFRGTKPEVSKRARNKCHITLPEQEFVRLAQSGLDFELLKKIEGMEFRDLYELSTRVTRYKYLLKEEA